MLIPGVDVPFHSTRLRDGVEDFAAVLAQRLPHEIDFARLENRYIPNLVARPFAFTKEFCSSILDVVPSAYVQDLQLRWETIDWDTERGEIGRNLLVELLSWQFASPVRWIETQDFLFSQSRIEEFVEIGLGHAPTLANLAVKTLQLPKFANKKVKVLNVQRDSAIVYRADEPTVFATSNSKTTDFADRESKNAAVENTVAELPEVDLPNLGDTNLARMADPNAASAALIATPAAPEALSAGAKNPEINFDAADALKVLLAYSTKIDLAQISAQDTIEILTNGVSSKRNQLLMDISAELGLSALEGGAEASIAELTKNICVAAHNYTPFGPVLSEIIAEHIRRLFGAAGASLSDIAKHVSTQWQLGAGWQSWVTAFVLLQTREGKSTRGGELAALPIPASMPEVFALIDQAVVNVGKFLAVTVAKPSANNAKGAGGAMVDAAALDEFKNFITGSLAENARDLLTRLGQTAIVENSGATDNELIETVTAELGASWTKLVANVFDSRKAVELNDRWATAREDVTRIALGAQISANFAATGAEVARQAVYLSEQTSDTEIKTRLLEIAHQAVDFSPGEFSGQIAVVTGMTPQSIAGAVTAKLLAGGATVIATASHISQQRLVDIRNLYRQSARGDAALWLVPANLGSYRDIDALIDWIGTEQTENIGGTTHLVKPALNPDLLFPFAAPRVMGTMEEAGPRAENEMRIMLWGVERLITGLGILGGEHHISHRLHTILPGSPNRGRFGGDGAYGEVKSALDAICNKWRVEPWGKHVTLAHARIGWVRGTGLMGGNDPLIAAVEAKGVRTWTTSEIAEKLIEISTAEARKRALDAPIDADFTGGLDEIDFTELTAQAGEHEAQVQTSAELVPDQMIQALPSPKQMKLAQGAELFPQGSAKPAEMIVIVGIGEVGTWGSARTRFAAELGIQDDGKVELTAAGVLELAWMMGLLTWHESPQAGWYDTADNLVEEQDIYSRFRDEVVARSGIRRLTDEESIHDAATTDMVTVFLDHPISFTVSSEAEAQAYFNADPQFTQISRASDDHKLWKVTRLKGATTLVPRRTTLSRFIAGQFPQGFDPQKWGIPAAVLESADKMAAWNLVATVDAFISAGFSPAELLQVVHPSSVGCTQGTGFGGMSSMRKLFVERFLNESVPQDILQETLPNVIAAHTMQAYVGGYGAMVQPVAACATAAVSLEEGVDKIATGKASFVVTGGIDDLSVESLEGFGFMNATADSQSLVDRGIHERFCSRAGDSRRDGFVEAQGGGTVLIARGDLALEMGLPVYGVVGYVQSFADGMHTSIPAPGIGALAAGQGGKESRLACALAELGVSSDDIAIVSKHDTSTKANDPNEAELHHLLAQALGRTPGNPLYVISQKTLTGHAKGGAALFQIAGMTQVFATGMIPANRSLDNLDPEFAVRDYLVWLRDPLNYGEHLPIKAGLITSLGFGHVSSVIALVHPGAFEAAIMRTHGTAALQQWREAALSRLHAGAQHLSQAMIGREALYQPQTGRRLPDVAHEAEISMLLDLNARLGADGKYGE
ncbi:beta-ketoacyl synthase N-terminal-like domain-containing protein [Arcanobacterium hippocoleae]|uniref:beta-ketoacyl synthase N-terminal-like domain-containing protein n=1 Tax=Arcanobacterium hippocoleae TaxID=149017 RepID=UPI0033404938